MGHDQDQGHNRRESYNNFHRSYLGSWAQFAALALRGQPSRVVEDVPWPAGRLYLTERPRHNALRLMPPTPREGLTQLDAAHAQLNPAGAVHLLNFRWLTALRWVAVVGQTLAVLFVALTLDTQLPGLEVGLIIGAEFAANLVATRRGFVRRHLSESELASWIGLDLVTFTLLLHFTGGPSNPFSFFYIVHVAIASLTLSAGLAWGLVLLSTISYGVVFAWHIPLNTGAHDWDVHLYGVWVAYGIGASCIVYFLQRARAALREREQELSEQRRITEQAERLSSLATLAAGAAHELANPLATIAVVSKELANELAQSNNHSAMQDVALVRGQVERCRKILARMAHAAGEAPGESNQWVTLGTLFREATDELPEKTRIQSNLSEALKNTQLNVPLEALAQALRVLLDNAFDATSSTVKLGADLNQGGLRIRVEDDGEGIDQNVLERVFEPFFTTKPAGKGMGLGLYLARNVASGLGGTLSLSSRPGAGTCATLMLPAQRVRGPR